MEKKSKTTTAAEPKRFSYEELEKLCSQLRGSNAELFNRLQNAEAVIAEFNEVGMLLSVLERSEFFKDAFVTRCSSKIQEIITNALNASEKKEEKSN